MSEKLMTRTYRGDLPQFRVMLHCLNKNWQGNRFITIACTKNWNDPDSTIVNDVKKIVQEELDNDWTVEFYPHLETKMIGYDEAQLYNFLMSLDDRFEESISIDSKDFLLKPANLNDFKVGNEYRVTKFQDTKIFSEFYRNFCDQYGIETLDIPLPIILTPYTFNCQQTKRIWNKLLERYGQDFTNWTMFPTGVEWCVYYVETMLDSNPIVKFTDEIWMPIGGFYCTLNIEEGLVQEQNFDSNLHTKFWKHHRESNVPDAIEITARMLKKYNIASCVIDRWISEII